MYTAFTSKPHNFVWIFLYMYEALCHSRGVDNTVGTLGVVGVVAGTRAGSEIHGGACSRQLYEVLGV